MPWPSEQSYGILLLSPYIFPALNPRIFRFLCILWNNPRVSNQTCARNTVISAKYLDPSPSNSPLLRNLSCRQVFHWPPHQSTPHKCLQFAKFYYSPRSEQSQSRRDAISRQLDTNSFLFKDYPCFTTGRAVSGWTLLARWEFPSPFDHRICDGCAFLWNAFHIVFIWKNRGRLV